jgi:hypothetical protein
VFILERGQEQKADFKIRLGGQYGPFAARIRVKSMCSDLLVIEVDVERPFFSGVGMSGGRE